MCFIWLYEIIFVPLQAKICVRIYVKRILYILGVLVVSLLLVSGMVIAALMSDKVETAAVRLVTAELTLRDGAFEQLVVWRSHSPDELLLCLPGPLESPADPC